MDQLQQLTETLNQKLTEIYDEVRDSEVVEKHDLLDSCVRSLFSSVIVGVYKAWGDEAAQKYAMEVALECFKNAEEFVFESEKHPECPHCGAELPYVSPYCPNCGKETGYVSQPEVDE